MCTRPVTDHCDCLQQQGGSLLSANHSRVPLCLVSTQSALNALDDCALGFETQCCFRKATVLALISDCTVQTDKKDTVTDSCQQLSPNHCMEHKCNLVQAHNVSKNATLVSGAATATAERFLHNASPSDADTAATTLIPPCHAML